MFYISFSLHILPTFIERGGSFLVSNSYPELVGVGMLAYLIIYREVSQTSLNFNNIFNRLQNKHFLGNHQTFSRKVALCSTFYYKYAVFIHICL